ATAHAAIRETPITPIGRAGAHPTYLVRAVVDAIAPRVGDGKIDIDRLPPNARDTYIRSERNLIRLREERGELILASEVERGYAAIFKEVARTFDTLPDIVERDCGLPAHALVRLEQVLDAARIELHRRINAKPAPAEGV